MWPFKRRPLPAPVAAPALVDQGHKFTLEVPCRQQIRAALDDADRLTVLISATVPYADGAVACGRLAQEDVTAEEQDALRQILVRIRDAHRLHLMHRSLDAMSVARIVARDRGEIA